MKLVASESGREYWETPKGSFWVPSGHPSEMLDFVLAEESMDIYNVAGLIRKGDTVLDCGADVGTFTRAALQRGAAKVVSIEPSPAKQECLRLTFAREVAEGKVILCPRGVWNEESTMYLDDDRLSESNGVSVPLTTIDKIVSDLRLERLDLIKMDIEGAEEKAIAGAQGTIRRFKPTFTIASEHKPDDHSRLPFLLHRMVPDYRVFCGPCVPQFGRLQPYTIQISADRSIQARL